MKHNFWKVLALAVLATCLYIFLAGRFNVISTVLGTILFLLLLTERPVWGAPTIDRCAWAAIFGLILLLAAGRLLEPIWAWLPFHFSRELLVSWLLLSVPGWWAGRSPASGN
jgi:hypothetical protein